MSDYDDILKKLPTYHGGKDAQLGRTMLARVGGAGGTRKDIHTSADGKTTTRLTTRHGEPTFETTTIRGKRKEPIYILSGIIISEHYPFGLQIDKAKVDGKYTIKNVTYVAPEHPFVIGTIRYRKTDTKTKWERLKSPDEDLDVPGLGCDTWYDVAKTYLEYAPGRVSFTPYAWSWFGLLPAGRNVTWPRGYLRCYYAETHTSINGRTYEYVDAFALTLPGQLDRDDLYIKPPAPLNKRVVLEYNQKPQKKFTGDIVSACEQKVDENNWVNICYGVPRSAIPRFIDTLSFARSDGTITQSSYTIPYGPVASPKPRVVLPPVFSHDGAHAVGAYSGYPFILDTLAGSISKVAFKGEKVGSVLTSPPPDDWLSEVKTYRNSLECADYIPVTEGGKPVSPPQSTMQYLRFESCTTVRDRRATTPTTLSPVYEWYYSISVADGSGADTRPGTAYPGGTTVSTSINGEAEFDTKLVLEPDGIELFSFSGQRTQNYSYADTTTTKTNAEVWTQECVGFSGSPAPPAYWWDEYINGASGPRLKEGQWLLDEYPNYYACSTTKSGWSMRSGSSYQRVMSETQTYPAFSRISGVVADFRAGLCIVMVDKWEASSDLYSITHETYNKTNWVLVDQTNGTGRCGPWYVATTGTPPRLIKDEETTVQPENPNRNITTEYWLVELAAPSRRFLIHTGAERYGSQSFIGITYAPLPATASPSYEARTENWDAPQLSPECHLSYCVSRDKKTVVVSLMEPHNANITRHAQEMDRGGYAKTDSLSKITTKNFVLWRTEAAGVLQWDWDKKELELPAIDGYADQLLWLSEIQLYAEEFEIK